MFWRFGKNFHTLKKESPTDTLKRLVAPLEAPKRFFGNVLILALIASVCVIIITLRDKLIDHKINAMLQLFYAQTANYGLKIDDIIIEGRDKTTLSELNEKIALNRGDSLLGVDMKALRARLEELPWVKRAQIRRTYFPNTLQIRLFEKEVIALWQSGNNFYPVDVEGNLIEAEYIPMREILVIVGRRAPEKIAKLLEITSSVPEIHQRIKAAVLYGGRRWDVILDSVENGVTLKLPAENVSEAWQRFNKINNTHGLLKRKLTTIDLRYKNKINVTVADSEEKVESNKKK